MHNIIIRFNFIEKYWINNIWINNTDSQIIKYNED